MRSRNKISLVTLSLAAALFLMAGMAAAQGSPISILSGSFTLPFDAQWGAMTLPAGDYTFDYSARYGERIVEVRGTAKGSPHGLVLPNGQDQSSAAGNGLVCRRAGDGYVIGALELPVIQTKLTFGLPPSAKILAKGGNSKAPTQLAQVRVPITVARK